MDVGEPVLSPPSGENPISGYIDQVLEVIRMRTQPCNGTVNKMLDANVGKFSWMSSAYGSMRLVRRENNPDKETLINIPFISCFH